MPYIDRNESGNIVGIYANAQRERHEWVEQAELYFAPTVPQTISRLQAKAALLQVEKLAEVEALMSHPDTPALTKLAWTDAQEFNRTSPTVLGMAQLLNLTDDDLDNLFILGSGIQV